MKKAYEKPIIKEIDFDLSDNIMTVDVGGGNIDMDISQGADGDF